MFCVLFVSFFSFTPLYFSSVFFPSTDARYEKNDFYAVPTTTPNHLHGNNLNINLPENNAVLRLEVELRDKNTRHRHHNQGGVKRNGQQSHALKDDINNYMVPMEKVSIIYTIHSFETGSILWGLTVQIFFFVRLNTVNTRVCKISKKEEEEEKEMFFSCHVLSS